MSKVAFEARHAPESEAQAAGGDVEAGDAPWLALVAEKVKSLNYGVVQIVVHDSRVVQVERTERHRFDVPRSA